MLIVVVFLLRRWSCWSTIRGRTVIAITIVIVVITIVVGKTVSIIRTRRGSWKRVRRGIAHSAISILSKGGSWANR